jgi:putative toxin-antitoxin system antitoxin component (TIGR02293 family)
LHVAIWLAKLRHMASSSATRVISVESRVADLLGQPATTRSVLDLVRLVRGGIRYRSLRTVAAFIDAPIEEVATSLGVARRTLVRRRAEGRLDPRTSEKIVRLARVAVRAEQVLGSAEEMRRWLRAPNRGLGNLSPVSMLDTDLGADAVLAVLGRLEHGVFS